MNQNLAASALSVTSREVLSHVCLRFDIFPVLCHA